MNETPSQSGPSPELEPWLIVLQDGSATSLALWRIDHGGESALALFSDHEQAAAYAANHCKPPFQIVQFDHPALVRVMADGFRQGLRYAALNPSQATARQVFVLRDVLKAAKSQLEARRP